MNDAQIRELEMGQRVRQFAKERPADFPTGSRAATVLDALEAAVDQAQQQAAKQSAATLDKQEQTEQKEAAIKTLLEQMRAFNLTARSIDQHFPGIADQFKMPRGGDQVIINYARGYISSAIPIANEFTTRGLPTTFLADLQTAIDGAEAAIARQATALSNQTAATAALVHALKQMRDAVRELDAIFRNKYRTDLGTLAAWDSASHVESAPKKKAELTSPPSSPPSK